MDATIQVFQREGQEAATTTRIAEVAGVSIGTLYQYFADRDAILDALQDREFDRATAMMEGVLSELASSDPPRIARAVVERLLALYESAPALHRVLVVEGLRVTPTARVEAFDMRMVQLIRTFLANAPVPIRRHNLDAAAFVAYHSVRACMLAHLLEAPPGLRSSAIVNELVDMVLRYLVRGASASRRSGTRPGLTKSD